MSTFKARGIVIKEVLVGESNKIVTLLLKEFGKVSVSARGARKSKSKFLAGTSLFSYSDFIIYTGNKYYTLSQIDQIESFYTLCQDIESYAYGTYFLDLIDKTILENMKCNEILLLLLKSLKALTYKKISNSLIARIFEFKFLQFNGYMPEIQVCINCNEYILKNYFFNINGLICENCSKYIKNTLSISDSTLYSIQYILNSDLNNLFNFNVSDNVLSQLKQISKLFFNEYYNLNLKTYKFLQDIEKNK